MFGLINLDLLSVAVATASIITLGFLVYFNNRQSVTNRSFLYFALLATIWSWVNYFAYQVTDPEYSLWLFRIVIATATWHSFFFFTLFYVFPAETKRFSRWFRFVLIPLVFLTFFSNLSSLTFSRVVSTSADGRLSKIENGPGIILFGSVITFLIVGGIVMLLWKTFKSVAEEKRGYKTVLAGVVLTFILIMTFNFILPAFFDNPRFIPLGALFFFPFVAFTSYAILKHKLFNIRVAGTAVLVFLLAIVTFGEVIFSRELSLIIYRASIFILVLVFGVILIRGVLREVEHRERLQKLSRELAQANEKLKELDKAKTEFVSLGSHQLRAPLTAIKGYASMILGGSFGEASEKVRGAVDVIFQSSQKLVRVIEDFLNITRIELGRMKYEMTEFDLRQMVETVLKEMGSVLKNGPKNLVLSFDYETGKDYKVKADYGKLAQVASNLIDNAIKYSEAGTIMVKLSKITAVGGSSKNRLEIKDAGIGMDEETLAKLFQKFTRADGAGQVNILGTGLGLFVAKQIVEAHGGKIWAESEGPGKGSRFVVEL